MKSESCESKVSNLANLQKGLDKEITESDDKRHTASSTSEGYFLLGYADGIKKAKELFSAFQADYAKLEKELAEYKETCKVLSDKPLMNSIRKARRKGSKSSPYKPLEAKV